MLLWPEGQLQPAAVKLLVLETANADNSICGLDGNSVYIASEAQILSMRAACYAIFGLCSTFDQTDASTET